MNDRNEAEWHDAEPYKAEYSEVPPGRSVGTCLLLGCLFLFLIMVVLAVVAGLAGYWFVKGQVNQYTADAPADLPVVVYSDEELAAIESRVEGFKESIENDEVPEPLVLTADDLNALISREDQLRGKVHVTIQDGKVSGQVSLPTDFIPGGKGRFFNASARFDVSLDDGVVVVTLADAMVKGKPVPAEIIESLSQENLAVEIQNDPEVNEMLRNFESLTIEDDKIILTPRPIPADDSSVDPPNDTPVDLPNDSIADPPNDTSVDLPNDASIQRCKPEASLCLRDMTSLRIVASTVRTALKQT